MLAAEESYAVENAVEDGKKAAKHICKSYTEKGVYHVLHDMLKEKEEITCLNLTKQ